MFEFIKKWYNKKFANRIADEYKVPNNQLNPKDAATALGDPWVAVLTTQVNPENPRNGFFELDWNEHFIVMLRSNGYTGGSDEEVVDTWFQDLCREIGSDEGIMIDRRFSGYINVNNLGNGRSEIS